MGFIKKVSLYYWFGLLFEQQLLEGDICSCKMQSAMALLVGVSVLAQLFSVAITNFFS
jgi:hypothetical protein